MLHARSTSIRTEVFIHQRQRYVGYFLSPLCGIVETLQRDKAQWQGAEREKATLRAKLMQILFLDNGFVLLDWDASAGIDERIGDRQYNADCRPICGRFVAHFIFICCIFTATMLEPPLTTAQRLKLQLVGKCLRLRSAQSYSSVKHLWSSVFAQVKNSRMMYITW